jgi:hypothetical protein
MSDSERIQRWEDSGGTVRVQPVDAEHVVVELHACTGELMERWITTEQAVMQRLQRSDSPT